MGQYSLTDEEQKSLDDFEQEGTPWETLFSELEEPKSSYENKLYDLIWPTIWSRLHQEFSQNGIKDPWPFFCLLEKEWNLEAPNPHAFEELATLKTAKFEPCGFIQNQHQNIAAKVLVGSVAWWFAPYSSGQSKKNFNFSQPSDALIASLVQYDTCFTHQGSIVSALKGLYSQFEKSEFKVFDFYFMRGQSDYSLQRERKEQERIEIERQEQEKQRREAERLELEKQRKEMEEEIAKCKRRENLHEKGKLAIEHWFVGDVQKYIEMAKEEKFADLFHRWLQDAEQLEEKVAGIRADNMVYRVHKIKSMLKAEALSAEVNN